MKWMLGRQKPQPIPQVVLQSLSQVVADELHLRTGMPVGHDALWDAVNERAVFKFKIGLNPICTEMWSIDSLKGALDFNVVAGRMISSVLHQNMPGSLGERADKKRKGTWAPEIAPVVDAQGRRHFRMHAEGGELFALVGAIGQKKNKNSGSV